MTHTTKQESSFSKLTLRYQDITLLDVKVIGDDPNMEMLFDSALQEVDIITRVA